MLWSGESQGSTWSAFFASAEAEPGYLKKIRHSAEHRTRSRTILKLGIFFILKPVATKSQFEWLLSFLNDVRSYLLIIRTSWFFTIVSTKFTFEGFLSFMNWTEFTWLCTCNLLLQYFHDKIIAFHHFLKVTCSSPMRVYGWLFKICNLFTSLRFEKWVHKCALLHIKVNCPSTIFYSKRFQRPNQWHDKMQ